MLMTSAKRLAPVLFLVLVLLALPQPARAARTIKVGDGTAASCTEAALRNALILAGGERSSIIQFKWGAKPVVITVTATLTIPDNTTINGNALITLDGNFFPGSILQVGPRTTVALLNSTIDRGGQLSGGVSGGTVTVADSAITQNTATVWGGGIFNAEAVTVKNSLITRNTAGTDGGGIYTALDGGGIPPKLRNSIVADNTPNDVAP
jgi:predicted outer membrane repeat protein